MYASKTNDANYIPDQLYGQIIKVMPIVCVDLVVSNPKGEILLLKRKNEPSKGLWWFPGGRVHFMETRKEAALRKLQEECGLKGNIIEEVGTYDLILGDSHAITTVFLISVNNITVIMDGQSSEFGWNMIEKWESLVSHSFLMKIFNQMCNQDIL